MTTKITTTGVVWGADPEFFFEKKGEIIGSERIIPPEGLTKTTPIILKDTLKDIATTPIHLGVGKIVRDGVQAEFNPAANTAGCRANFGNELVGCFKFLARFLEHQHPDVRISIRPLVSVKKREMDKLSDKSKILGCAPSLNLYDSNATPGVDGTIYKKRSAGGHIHLGLNPLIKALPNYPQRVVALMDAMVGNTCVLLDQDPLNRERRTVYGRAGEYRVPPHGVEYRTLSNFWLRAAPLLGLILGLSRYVVGTIYTSSESRETWNSVLGRYEKITPSEDLERKLFKDLDQKKIVQAINENDYSMAFSNWQVVRDFLMNHVEHGAAGGIGQNYMHLFDHFLEMTRLKGLEYWFPDDPLTHWTAINDCHYAGMETFLTGKVTADLAAFNLKKGGGKV